ncbi:MAG: 4'-phosphopantetheinyl transferase superfamily protein [Duncaniella sp.]|nr:4'-phosphopantetheinyl transferase superfamily protein [Muribaculum sp.]MCM1255442.1 4'-phosphopantetheinyl transferase superfamily protein [Duncaniella sp.]
MQKFNLYTFDIPSTPALPRRERERLAVKQLLTQALGQEARLNHDAHGSPFLPDYPEFHISISHSTNHCILVTSDLRIGTDIESRRPQLMRIAHKFLTPNEKSIYEALQAKSPGEGTLDFLLKLWTAKEATFKAAAIPDLVVSEIDIDRNCTTATARGHKFSLFYPTTPFDETIAVAIPQHDQHPTD